MYYVVTLLILMAWGGPVAAATTLHPTPSGDRTAAIQQALDATSQTLVTGSGSLRQGGTVTLTTGKYPIGGLGAVAHCAGGLTPGAVCRGDAECGTGTSTETRSAYCAWLVVPRPTLLMGEGIGTELIVTPKPGEAIHTLVVGPGAPYSEVRNLHLSSHPKRTGGKGIIVLGRMVSMRGVTVDSFGGDGIFADGMLPLFNVNNLSLADVEVTGSGGDGVHVVSGAAKGPTDPPSAGGDASQMYFINVSAMSNIGAGFNLRSSKGTFLSMKTNGNAIGFRTRGSQNVASIYSEIANQHPSVWFETGSQGNLVFDLSQAAMTAGKYKNDGLATNRWYSNGAMRP